MDVHERTVRRLIDDKKIQAFKFGYQWRIKEHDLIMYLDARSNFKDVK